MAPSLPPISLTFTRSWHAAISTLALLHSYDPLKIGLSDYGAHSDFYPRQVRSLGRVSQSQAEVRSKDGSEAVGPIPAVDWLLKWYSENCPKGELTIVHGDYKLDNLVGAHHWNSDCKTPCWRRETRASCEVAGNGSPVYPALRDLSVLLFPPASSHQIFHPTEPRVIGILDWELSTLGHPLSDLANLLQPFDLPHAGLEGTVLQGLQ